MSFLNLAAGDRAKGFNDLCVWPDTTLQGELDTLVAANSNIEELLVSFATSANMTVTSPADNAAPEARIINHEEDADNGYLLTIRLFAYVDVEGTYHWGNPHLFIFNYSGTIALGQQIVINGATFQYVDGVNTGGVGKVVSIDDPADTCAVLL